MYRIKATLRSKADPALGSVTIRFPIPWQEYDKILEQLKPLGIGGSLDQDCQIETLDSHCSILKQLEKTVVNLDDLDYLAKRLDSFDGGEALQFQAAAAAKGISSIQDFINLTFCCQQVTVVRDFRDLKDIGRDHIITTQGRGFSDEEWEAIDFHAVAIDLLQNGDGKITPYGVVYDNGMELRPLYTRGPFPAYGCGEPLVVVFKPQEGSEENFLFLPMAESRLCRELERSGVIDPDNFELCRIDDAPIQEIASSLSLEKEDIFSLNRLAAALESLSPAEAEKLKAAAYLTEPDSSEKFLVLMKKVEQLASSLRPLSTKPSVLRLYMPLTAELYERDEYGDREDDPKELSGGQLWYYKEAILEGLVKMESRKQGTGQLPYLKLLQLTENTDCCHWVPQARNDSQLGRFYAENGFVEGIDDLPDKLFEMLDFEKIGREMRLAEGGVFTEDSGYVVQHEKLREVEKVPNLDLQKPLYTIAMEIRKAGEENGPWLTIELPLIEGKLEEFQKRFPREEYAYSCIDCAIPFFGEYISGGDAGLPEINGLARIMDFALARDELAKYKAILLATGCRDVRLAAELGRQRSMEEYRFLPYQNENGPEEYAAGWLKKKLGRDAALVPDLGLEELVRRLMERNHVTETNYGPIRRIDGQPIQRFDLERTPGFQMGGMGGM